jgi:hypothetical protein
MIAIPFFTSLLALFLCFLSTVFGNANGAVISLDPDYNTFGWVVRGLGALLAITAIITLVTMRPRLDKGSFTTFLGKVTMILSISCVVWEIAMLFSILLFACLLLYSFATGDGFDL